MDDLEYQVVKRRIHTLTGTNLDAYKSPQVRRRIDGYLSRLHITSSTEFLRYLSDDPQAIYRLRDFLAINVSSFFRDHARWTELRHTILPTLYRPGRPMRVWSAACSHGAEAYSLAMLLEEEPAWRRGRVIGTDIDQAALQQARAGGPYTREETAAVPREFQAKYLIEQEGRFWVGPLLRERVQFTEMDLFSPRGQVDFDLILCRNVLIYFTESAKWEVLTRLAQSLRTGGVLFIGATESISHEQSLGLERAGLSFFRRCV